MEAQRDMLSNREVGGGGSVKVCWGLLEKGEVLNFTMKL